MNMTSRNPSEMTAQDRMDEAAAILAKAVIRYKNKEQNQGIERSFTGLQGGSKHSCDDQKRSNLRAKKKART
jgi:hypothetical protein